MGRWVDRAPGATKLIVAALLAIGALRCADAGMADPPEPFCDCSDVDPRDSFLRAKVDFTCFEQSRFGTCNEPFMKETPEEVPEGYCQISCGRCACCNSLDAVLQYKGLNMFRWMLGFSEYGAYTQLPGYMATLLAPSDGAVWAALNRLGYTTKAQVEADGNAKGIISDLGKYHVLPPVQPINAAWTAPFMRRDVRLATALQAGPPITARRDKDGRTYLNSPRSGAGITEQDVYACKGYIQVIDSVLVPWEMNGYKK